MFGIFEIMNYLGERGRSYDLSEMPDMSPKLAQIFDAPMPQILIGLELHLIFCLYELSKLIQASGRRILVLP